ncbi:unnamed protein product [Diatraea saccharalis]|uniref:Uncharacterized protein n=1 Tax=Diatraea saccharalis TaxID=40085 RepID=A0A9P0C8U6_9NEOP|nr:unnamed protein product [Diatraea saccharalis]
MVCYKYEDCGPPKGKTAEGVSKGEEGGAEKKDEKENQLKRTKSRELRGGVMYYSCHCIKRNGLQHDCRRTGCGGEPACLVLPDPVCAPSQLARARGLADPAPFAAHLNAQGGGASGSAADSGSSGGKKFIVCELKGIVPDISTDKGGKCCKCPVSTQGSIITSVNVKTDHHPTISKCPCGANSGRADVQPPLVLDKKLIESILKCFEAKELAQNDIVLGPGGRVRKTSTSIKKDEPCTRPGCIHWQPPPPCMWDAPCKADCFEARPGIQPGRNQMKEGGVLGVNQPLGQDVGELNKPHQINQPIKLLTPNCCTGCSTSGGGGGPSSSGGQMAGLPVMVMKLC